MVFLLLIFEFSLVYLLSRFYFYVAVKHFLAQVYDPFLGHFQQGYKGYYGIILVFFIRDQFPEVKSPINLIRIEDL